MMKIVKLTKANLAPAVRQAADILKKNGLVIIPSDTAYGLAAKATSSKAVQKIFDFKGHRFGKGISIFVNNIDSLKKYALFNSNQEKIISTLLPGSFTVILKSKGKTAPQIEAPDKTIGLRLIENNFVQALTKALPFPFTATSANLSGKGPHYSISSFLKTLSQKKKEMLDLIIDTGQLPRVPTSTVVRLVEDEIKILRPGLLNPRLLFQKTSLSEKNTKQIAQKIYRSFLQENLQNQAVVLILQGDLGSGKTIFAKGIGELFNQNLTSPTFTLMDERIIRKKPLKNLYHLDLYRLETEEEVLDLKLEEFLQPGNLVLIEWGEKLSVFQKLKKEKIAFFLLQLEEKGKSKRKLSFYQI